MSKYKDYLLGQEENGVEDAFVEYEENFVDSMDGDHAYGGTDLDMYGDNALDCF